MSCLNSTIAQSLFAFHSHAIHCLSIPDSLGHMIDVVNVIAKDVIMNNLSYSQLNISIPINNHYIPLTEDYRLTVDTLQLQDHLIGIAINGIPIYSYSYSSTDNTDIFRENNGSLILNGCIIDECGGCFGMTSNGFRYHYRMIPSCVFIQDIDYESLQHIIDGNELLEKFQSFQQGTVLGYTLTGHEILSPFTERGLLQNSLDECNGKFTGNKYSYFVTSNFPYITTWNCLVREIIPLNFTTTLQCSSNTTKENSIDNDSQHFCPAGRYSAFGRVDCALLAPLGYYSNEGDTFASMCPGGRYGSQKGLTTPLCSGPCKPGYFCREGSISNQQNSCRGSSRYYCPAESSKISIVDVGYYTVDNSMQVICPMGSYCLNGIKYYCLSGTFGSSVGLISSSCTDVCPVGYYCPKGSSKPIECPAGKFGNTTGLDSEECSGDCELGYWCTSGSISPRQNICDSGRYAVNVGMTASTCCFASDGCNNFCSAGYYCPSGSISNQQVECGNSSVYCPLGSSIPTPVNIGYYTIGKNVTTRTDQLICEPGYYCIYGMKYICPPGRYGSEQMEAKESCSGLCKGGYYCNAGSTTDTQFLCGNSSWYCPIGSFQPTLVPPGYYSIGYSSTTAFSIKQCPPGFYCLDGIQYICAAGRYSVNGSSTADCDGQCTIGYYCMEGSSSPRQFSCPKGTYGSKYGLSTSNCSGLCSAGYYCPENSTSPFQFECGGEDVFCPIGSFEPTKVNLYHYSTGGMSTTRTGQSKCNFDTPLYGKYRHNICPDTTVFP